MCHTAARTSPMTTTRRGNLGVAKNSRIAKRYTMPASVREAMKRGPPLSPKLREQIVSATHNVAPSRYSLHAAVSLTTVPRPSVIASPQAATLLATLRFVAPVPGPASTPLPTESGLQLHQHRKKELPNAQKAQEFVRARVVSPAR